MAKIKYAGPVPADDPMFSGSFEIFSPSISKRGKAATKRHKQRKFAWIPEEILSYKALYKGRRYWVFENDFSRPYEIYNDEESHQLLIFDATVGVISGSGSWGDDGQIHGWLFWGQGIDFTAANAAEIVEWQKRADKWNSE